MKNNKNKKIAYWITSSAAVLILGLGIIISNNTFHNSDVQNPNYKIGDLSNHKENREESLTVELQINKIEEIASKKTDGRIEKSLDADAEYIDIEKLPEQLKFIENIKAPQDFKLNDVYKVYVRSNIETKEYDLLHDYVISYKKDDEHDIRIAFSTVKEPLRDYYLEGDNKISKIGDIELKISQYEEIYMATFKINNTYFDIETNGITEDELVELLKTVINESKTINNKNINIEEKDANVNEAPKENTSEKYPDYYAGKYIDNNGSNVILLCEDTVTNRKNICKLLGITESKTIFKTAKYSYKYLTELQNKITKKMIGKEFTFVTSSAVMEDSNNIKVTVTSQNESDLKKIKALDTIGGAIDIQYGNGMIKEDLLVKKE